MARRQTIIGTLIILENFSRFLTRRTRLRISREDRIKLKLIVKNVFAGNDGSSAFNELT